eukprot:TRINITY_DN681_c0_g1_i6.p1 TRINITY_DN681_c0_g1~~TRINITY_DN681_c0_g1_i6.p1  ORF type:complete len:263 (+),score=48.77 TRINITY_DN681_c0_g1_i6:969-1757(+)
MFSIEGEHLCSVSYKKAIWYVDRGKAEIIELEGEEPKLQLNFKTKGRGHVGDPFHLGKKINQCVVCGEDSSVVRHNIVPSFFKKYFPLEIKEHSSHDIILLCQKCHRQRSMSATNLRNNILRRHGLPERTRFVTFDKEIQKIVKMAKCLLVSGDVIPPERYTLYETLLKEHLRIEETLTTADIEHASNLIYKYKKEEISPGKTVVNCLETIQDYQMFVEKWRKHFVNTMNPRYLHRGWRVDYPIVRFDEMEKKLNEIVLKIN